MKATAATRTVLVSLTVIGFAAGVGRSLAEDQQKVTDEKQSHYHEPKTPLERGSYLVQTMGCNDCHTPWKVGPHGPEPDMTRMLSGHPADFKMPPPPDLSGQPWMWVGAATNTAYAGPWGVSYATNLTPDSETGIGLWTEDQFLEVFHSMKIMGGSRPVMPPMPVASYRHMPDADLQAIFAFLKSIPPVKNQVPAYQAPPPGTPKAAAPKKVHSKAGAAAGK